MITAEKRCTPPPYDGPINETERRVIPYSPPVRFSPPHGEKSVPHRPKHRLLTAVSAVFCMFTVTLTLLNVLLLSENFRPDALLLRLGSRAFFGMATISVTPEETADSLPPELSPADTESEDTLFPPAETKTEPPSDAALAAYPIRKADISCEDVHALNNETDYRPDTRALLDAPLPFSDLDTHMKQFAPEMPYILILHTHGTEGFADESADTYTPDDAFRTENTEENIVAVGAVMAETFRAAGVPVLHCTEMFDLESYQDSYSRAAAAIRAYLKEYPSIQIVLDVHRDSIIRTDMTKIRPATTVDGKEAAQLMTVVGTDFKGADHPDWTNNLNFALKMQENLTEKYAHFVRAVNLRGAGFNQQYTDGSLLLEVGSCGNTLSEAKRAGVLAALAITEVVTGKPCPVGHTDILP